MNSAGTCRLILLIISSLVNLLLEIVGSLMELTVLKISLTSSGDNSRSFESLLSVSTMPIMDPLLKHISYGAQFVTAIEQKPSSEIDTKAGPP